MLAGNAGRDGSVTQTRVRALRSRYVPREPDEGEADPGAKSR